MSSFCIAKQMGPEERGLARGARREGGKTEGVIEDEAKMEGLGPGCDLLQMPWLNNTGTYSKVLHK